MLKRMVNAITSYPQLKGVALVIAIIVWFYANSRVQQDVSLRIPIHVHVPDNYELVYKSHQEVKFQLSGPQYIINRCKEQAALGNLSLRVPLDAEENAGETADISVDPSWLNIPDTDRVRMDIVPLNPSRIRVRTSPVVTQQKPVQLNLSGVPRRGYQIKETSTMPPEVEVTGPAIALEQMEKVPTEEVALWDVSTDFRRTIRLRTETTISVGDDQETSVKYEVDPHSVAVHVKTGQEDTQRTIENLPVRLMIPPDFPFAVEIGEGESDVDVVISGVAPQIENVSQDSLMAFVDLSELADEDIDKGEKAMYKENVQIRQTHNREIQVESITPPKVTTILKNIE